MLKTIEAVNNVVNNFIWGIPAMICIIGVGLFLSFRTKFIQIRKFPYSIKNTLGRIFDKSEAADGSITPFQAVCTALAGTVGTGNIAGVAGAITVSYTHLMQEFLLLHLTCCLPSYPLHQFLLTEGMSAYGYTS